MRTRQILNITLGITTEVFYALLIVLAAFIACLAFYLKA
jgi:hypothetical protein